MKIISDGKTIGLWSIYGISEEAVSELKKQHSLDTEFECEYCNDVYSPIGKRLIKIITKDANQYIAERRGYGFIRCVEA